MHRRRLLARAFAVVVVTWAVLPGVLRAEDDPLASAAALRQAASEDWAQHRYAEAAEKLTRASALYDAAGNAPSLDRAITWRALVWNLVRANDAQRALRTYERLIALGEEDPTVLEEVDAAWGAVWEAASRRETLAGARKTIDPVREAARAHGNRSLWAQATHSLGSIAGSRGETATAASLFGEAIAARREIGDAVGLAWSLNNLANLHLRHDDPTPALEPLAEAHRVLHTKRVAAVQRAVAWNLRKALDLFDAQKIAGAPAWLHARAAAARASGYGAVLPPSHLEREALRLAQVVDLPAEALRPLLASIVALPTDPAVPELRADIVLRAARLAVSRLGAYEDARRWLKDLEPGMGPCRPHLAARLALARALAWAEPGRRWDDFAVAAQDARSQWASLGDWQGRREALAALVAAARHAHMDGHVPNIVEESEALALDGKPGGAGGSAQSGGDRSRGGDLPPDEAVLRISMKADGQTILVEDVAAGFGVTRLPAWHASHVAINGMGLTFFGGYVAVREANYGRGATATGASGTATLDDVGAYMPIPQRAALLVQKNGGMRYDAAR